METGNVVTVVGLKGGVGKTTLAVNLGVGLAEAYPQMRVAVVDANPLLGDVGPLTFKRGRYSVVELALLAAEPEGLAPDVMERAALVHKSGLRLFVAPPYPRYPQETGILSRDLLHNLLETLKTYFHYVIVDTSPALDGLLAACIEASDGFVAVATPSVLALKDTSMLLSELGLEGFLKSDVVLALNQIQPKGRVTVKRIEKLLGRTIDAQIPFDAAAEEAANQGEALIQMNPRKAPSAKALRELVQTVAERFPVMPGAAEGTRIQVVGRTAGPARPPYLHPQREHVSVVIADDQPVLRETIEKLLELDALDNGADVRVEGEAHDGRQAIQLAGDVLPDVILMDVNMPNLDGFEATRQIRAKYPSIAIIIVTVQEDIGYWREALQAEVADFIPKAQLGGTLARSVLEAHRRYEQVRVMYREPELVEA